MNTEVTPEQIAFYRENGFVVFDDFLTPEELEIWRKYVDEAVAQREDFLMATRDARADKVFYEQVFIQRINLWNDHAGMKELMFDARLGKMMADLAGVDGIRIWHDQALIKPAWGNPTGWHLDNPFWSFTSRDSLSIWVALDDATLENGCLYFLPGTHKLGGWDVTKIGENVGDLFKIYPEWATMKAIPAPMKAGSCSVHNGFTAHGANTNMTPGPRRAMTCAYMPDGSTFSGRKNILPQEYFEKLKLGDLLDDDNQNPLIYHRSKPYITA